MLNMNCASHLKAIKLGRGTLLAYFLLPFVILFDGVPIVPVCDFCGTAAAAETTLPAVAEPLRRDSLMRIPVSSLLAKPFSNDKRPLTGVAVIEGKVARSVRWIYNSPSISHEKHYSEIRLSPNHYVPTKPRVGVIRLYYGHFAQSGVEVPADGELYRAAFKENGKPVAIYPANRN